ncbi:MAG: DNA methyltransferase [Rhodobacteraceae bacterium]|nr:DNA methyltransferase [Paracoccaceae bacterium]
MQQTVKGLLLDPFAGSGSSLLAALQSGMGAVGFDINPEYRIVFEQRLSLFNVIGANWRYEPHDARHLADYIAADSMEICITSPPYWDILNQKRTADGKASRSYSANGHDLGNLENYQEFLSALGQVAGQVVDVLRPCGYFILNVMDIRKGPKFYPLHQDTSSTVLQSGSFTLEDIIVWDRQSDYNAMRPLGYPRKFIINKVHEYLLIFRKGD